MIETKVLIPNLGVEEVGDLATRDNTGVPHRALPYAPSSERTPHRTTIGGGEAFS